MANANITSRSPFAQMLFNIFGKKSYHPPVPAPFCVIWQTFPFIKPAYSMGFMETLCAPFTDWPTIIKPPTENIDLFRALFFEPQLDLIRLGASSADAEKRVLLGFSP